MEPLVQVALAGTGRGDAKGAMPANGAEALVTEQAADGSAEKERQVLLRAGASAVYRQAGRVVERCGALPAPAPAETLPVCSPGAARLCADMFSDPGVDLFGGLHVRVLPEVLDRLRRAGMRLPRTLLPAALDCRFQYVRSDLAVVVGESGRWLARFNPQWSWVEEALVAADEGVPADAETLWQEGALLQRVAVLRRVRGLDPTRGREWIEAVWPREKADARKELVEALAIGLSADDEPFLEKALDDKGGEVRKAAVALLARLPGSAYEERMVARADALLDYAPSSGETSDPYGQLRVEPPSSLPRDWQRDGIDLKSPGDGLGDRANWLIGLLSAVPPAHWSRRFGVTPAVLIAAAGHASRKGDDPSLDDGAWGWTVLEGWARATVAYRAADWAPPLWTWCSEHKSADSVEEARVASLLVSLTWILPRDEAERLVATLFRWETGTGVSSWTGALQNVPRPWSDGFGRVYLAGLRTYLETTLAAAMRERHEKGAKASHAVSSEWDRTRTIISEWDYTMQIAALALPPACFDEALALSIPSVTTRDDSSNQWQRQMEAFRETIGIRKQVMREIPVPTVGEAN